MQKKFLLFPESSYYNRLQRKYAVHMCCFGPVNLPAPAARESAYLCRNGVN